MNEDRPQIETDRLLAASVAGGDQVAFNEFFREYFPRLYRFTLSRTDSDPELAEEIVQRTIDLDSCDTLLLADLPSAREPHKTDA